MAKKSRYRAKQGNQSQRVASTKIYRVMVETGPHETVRNLGRFRLAHCCMPQPARDATGGRKLHAFASGAAITDLRKAGRKVHVLANAMTEGKRAQKNIGKGDRFQGGRRGPSGIGKLI